MLNSSLFEKPIVFFTNGIGDHLMVLPTLRALSNIFNGNLSLICSGDAHTEFFSDIEFREVWSMPIPKQIKESLHLNIFSRTSFNFNLLFRQVKYCDLFISLAPWESDSLTNFVSLLSPSVSLGYFPSFSYQTSDYMQHTFDRDFEVVKVFKPNFRIEDFSQGIHLNEKHKILAHSLKNELSSNQKLLVIHTDTKRRKMWAGKNFLITIDNFLSVRPEYICVIVGNYHEIPIEQAVNRNRVFTLNSLPINLSFAVISVADLFLGIDSCMLHAADLFRIPSVGLFGPTNPERWGCRFTNYRHIKAEQLDSLTPKQVITALCELSN